MGHQGKGFKLRVERIKQVPFLDALDAVAPGLDYDRARVPYHILCPAPDHHEITGSFYIYGENRGWWCFSCDRGGDIIDFAQHCFEIENFSEALAHVEAALGITNPSAGEMAELALKAAMARIDQGRDHRPWEARVWEINDEYVDQIRPYLRHPDRVIQDRAWSVSESVFEEIDALMRQLPRTPRRVREELRRTRRLVIGHALGVERDIEAWTGKDRLDVTLEAPVVLDPLEGLGRRMIRALELD